MAGLDAAWSTEMASLTLLIASSQSKKFAVD